MTGNTIDATEAQAAEIGGGLVRIEVTEQTARHSWQHHRRFGNILPRNADDLESSARERGSDPEQWRISYHDVPLANFVSIEAYSDGEWTEAARRNDAGEWLMGEMARGRHSRGGSGGVGTVSRSGLRRGRLRRVTPV